MDLTLVLLIVVLAIFGAGFWFVFHRPRDGSDTPRDELAMRAKTSVSWKDDMFGRDAAHDLLKDAADCEGEAGESHHADGVPDDHEDWGVRAARRTRRQYSSAADPQTDPRAHEEAPADPGRGLSDGRRCSTSAARRLSRC